MRPTVYHIVAGTTPKAAAQVIAFQPHAVRLAWEMAKDDGFRVVIAHPRDVECALLAFAAFLIVLISFSFFFWRGFSVLI